MPWVTKRVYRSDIGVWESTRVWVADTSSSIALSGPKTGSKKKKKKAKSTLNRKKAIEYSRQQKLRAERIRKQRLAQQERNRQKQKIRNRAAEIAKRENKQNEYRKLQTQIQLRAHAIREQIAPPKLGQTRVAVTKYDPLTGKMIKTGTVTTGGFNPNQRAAATPGRAKGGSFGPQVGSSIALSGPKTGINLQSVRQQKLDQAKKAIGSKASGEVLTQLLKEARDNQAKYGGRSLNQKFVDDVLTSLESHSQHVYNRIEKRQEYIGSKWMYRDKKGVLQWKSQKDYDAAVRYMDTAGYKKEMGEYDRLFVGKANKDGVIVVPPAFEAAGKIAKDISDTQGEYIRDAAKSAFFAGTNWSNPSAAAEKIKKWETEERWGYFLSEAEIKKLIKANETSIIYDPTTGKSRHRTPEEEYQYRGDLYRARVKAEYKEMKNKETILRQTIARERRLDPTIGQRERDAKVLSAIMQKQGTDLEGLQYNRDKMVDVVDEAVRDWERKNKALFQDLKPGNLGNRSGNLMSNKNFQIYARAKEQYERRLYAIFGSGKVEGLELATRLPIIKPALQLLDVGTGGIGAGLRLGTAWLSKETSKVFGTDFNQNDAPPAAISVMDKAEAAYRALPKSQQRPGNLEGQVQAVRTRAWYAWLKSPAGKDWAGRKTAENKQANIDENWKFYDALHGETSKKGDIWDKFNAISQFGLQPFNNDFANLAFQFVADPTAALPLKLSTWAARWVHAADVASRSRKILRPWKAAVAFQKVTEPELRMGKLWAPTLKKLANGADPVKVQEEFLDALMGVPGPNRNKAIEDLLKDAGINPRSADGHSMLTAAQEGLKARLEKAGFDWKGTMDQATARQKQLRAEELAEKIKTNTRATAYETAQRAKQLEKETKAAQLHVEWEARTVPIEVRMERPTVEARVPRWQRWYKKGARTAADQAPVEPLAHVEEDSLKFTFDDELRAQVADGLAFGSRPPDILGGVDVTDIKQEAGDMVHLIQTGADSVDILDTDFAKNAYTEAYQTTDEFALVQKYLAEPMLPRIPDEAASAIRVAQKANKDWARRTLYQRARESAAWERRIQEGLNRQPTKRVLRGGRAGKRVVESEKRPGMVDGWIPWVPGRNKGDEWAVEQGLRSGQHWIETSGSLAERMGYYGPAQHRVALSERRAFEGMKQRLVQNYQKYWHGTWTQEQWDDELEQIRSIGMVRRSTDLTVDMRIGEGRLVYLSPSELEEMRAGRSKEVVAVGDALVEDFLDNRGLTHYYESLSLLPNMTKGEGYETMAMARFLDPTERYVYSRADLAQLLRTDMFLSEGHGPMQFRVGAMHLMTLFHLTLLDAEKDMPAIQKLVGQWKRKEISDRAFRIRLKKADTTNSMERLRQYSLSIESLLAAQPHNLYGRAWKVMETRAGVYWADDFALSEGAFIAATLRPFSKIHAHLALGMIPFGPLSRNLPITHGFTGHLKNLATSFSHLIKASGPTWVDDDAAKALQRMAKDKRLSVIEKIQIATQFSHYQATRYGNNQRRTRFRNQTISYGLDAMYEQRAASPLQRQLYQQMRQRFIDWRRNSDRFGESIGGLADPVDELVAQGRRNEEKYAREFDDAFQALVPKHHKSRTYNDVMARMFEEAYWRGEVRHSDAGLHTHFFLDKMADPTLQRGESWLRYANAYWDHMVFAGAEDEARIILGEVFEPVRRRAIGDAFESIAWAQRKKKRLPDTWLGGVNEFLIKAGLLPDDMTQIIAEGEQRAERAKGWAREEEELSLYRDELQIVDDALREAKRQKVQEPESASMYDFADIEQHVEAVSGWTEEYHRAVSEVETLSRGLTKLDVAIRKVDDAEDEFLFEQAQWDYMQEARVAGRSVRGRTRRPSALVKAEKAYEKALDEARTLAHLVNTDAVTNDVVVKGVLRPSEGRMKAIHGKIRSIQRDPQKYLKQLIEEAEKPIAKTREGDLNQLRRVQKNEAERLKRQLRAYRRSPDPSREVATLTREFIRNLPDDVRPWISAELRGRKAAYELDKHMRQVVERSLDNATLPADVATEMKEIVDTIKGMPAGQRFLEKWAKAYYQDLFESRLIDYFKNEDWFRKINVAKAPREAFETDLGAIVQQIGKLRDEIGSIEGRLREGVKQVPVEGVSRRERAANVIRGKAELVTRASEEGQRRLARRTEQVAGVGGDRGLRRRALTADERAALEERRNVLEMALAEADEDRVKLVAERKEGQFAVEGTADLQAKADVVAEKLAAAKDAREKLRLQRELDGYNEAMAEIRARKAPTAEELNVRPPREPTPEELNHPRIGVSQGAIRILEQMSEEEWLAREFDIAARARKYAKSKEAKKAAIGRMRNVRHAQEVLTQSKKGGRTPFKNMRSHVASVKSVMSERAKGVLAPKFISAYVTGMDGLQVEYGRTINRLRLTAQVSDELQSGVRQPGQVSATYKAREVEIELWFGGKLNSKMLSEIGFPDDLLDELTVTQFLTNLDEFERCIGRSDQFRDFVLKLTQQADRELRDVANDPSYSIEQWMNDRLRVRGGTHFDPALFEEIEEQVQSAIRAARNDEIRQTKTDLRRLPGNRPENPLTELVETDVRAVIAKAKTLGGLGVDPHAYNEARKVLRTALQRKRYGRTIVAIASEKAYRGLYLAGKTVDDPNWDAMWRAAYDEEFLAQRTLMADKEAVKLLGILAQEMNGYYADEIMEEFERRYSMDFDVKGYEPGAITPFQMKTLEETAKWSLGVNDLDDLAEMRVALAKHGQAPPMDDRGLMVEWLTKYGFWSKRTGEQIAASGAKSWDIFTEMKYYRDTFAYVPEWADATLWEEGGRNHHMLFDERARGDWFREQGLFTSGAEARMATSKMSRAERIRYHVEGSQILGIKGRRDLDAERKYVIERYKHLATDEKGELIAFPELMHKEELKRYIQAHTRKGVAEGIPPHIFQSIDEFNTFHEILAKHLDRYTEEFILQGRPATYEDVFTMSANVVRDMLLDPVWLRRDRDAIGRFLRGQAAFRRALVFTQIGFLTTNVVDTFIKGPWTAFTNRSFMHANLSAEAMALELIDFGWRPGGAILRDVPVHGTTRIGAIGDRPARQYFVDGKWIDETPQQRANADAIQRLIGISELPAQGAGAAEDFMKLRLARHMYDETYARALAKVGPGNEGLADAMAKTFISKEVNRLWPTVGDGPIENLFNQVSPFLSYQFRNRVVFIGEMISHPVLFNYFNRIGDYIEKQNRDRWTKDGTLERHKEWEFRLIELPWAPGMFIDLGTFSDAQRGLKPLYDYVNGKATVGSLASQFVRLASANDINMAMGIMNAFHIGFRKEWVQGKNEEGYPDGTWTQVEVPWEAPWGGTANFFNSFWPVEIANTVYEAAMDGKFNVQELTQVAYQTMFFGSLKQHDVGAGLNSFYYALKSRDPDAAQKWLDETKEGSDLRAWWADKVPKTYEYYVPQVLKDLMEPPREDKYWRFHTLSKADQALVKQGGEDLDAINKKWEAVFWKLTPGTPEWDAAKLARSEERWKYYDDHPWMIEADSLKSPEEWAKTLDTWTIDDLTSTYMKMEAPKAEDFKTAVLWQKAMVDWRKQREAYLKAFPQVKERLGSSRDIVEQVWKQTEEEWFRVLDDIGVRSVAIEAAKQANNYDLVDQLYLANDLDYKKLQRDVSISYFDPTTDYNSLLKDVPSGMIPEGARLRTDPFGQSVVKKLKIFPDFDKWRYGRLDEAGKAKFRRDAKYAAHMKTVIAKAKAGKNFGADFVEAMRKDPWLREEYFRRNPGKREQWAATDNYISLISKYGILAKQGRFAEAGRYFDNLPDWVKARYYAKHPEKKQRLQQNLAYNNWMGRWVSFYKKRDYKGGAAFFDKMPEWVKSRYYQKHPGGFGRGGGSGGTSGYAKAMGQWVDLLESGDKEAAQRYFDSLPAAYKARYRSRHPESAYSKAMGKWVGMLEAGDKEGAKKFFASLPKAIKDRYYSTHPEQKLRDDIKRTGQLAEYFSADDANRAEYLKDNPEFAKWLKSQSSNEQTRRMLIMAGYRAIPKDEQWMKRVYREKYPEVFSKEAAGEASLKKTYNFLGEHPEMLPAFEKWLAAVWASYAENVKHAGTKPKPIESVHPRQHGMNQRRPHRGKSAAWVRLHSLS